MRLGPCLRNQWWSTPPPSRGRMVFSRSWNPRSVPPRSITPTPARFRSSSPKPPAGWARRVTSASPPSRGRRFSSRARKLIRSGCANRGLSSGGRARGAGRTGTRRSFSPCNVARPRLSSPRTDCTSSSPTPPATPRCFRSTATTRLCPRPCGCIPSCSRETKKSARSPGNGTWRSPLIRCRARVSGPARCGSFPSPVMKATPWTARMIQSRCVLPSAGFRGTTIGTPSM